MDPLLLTLQLLLGALGILGVAAAAPTEMLAQAGRFAFCVVVTIAVSRATPLQIVRAAPFAYVVTMGLLVAVLFVGVSPTGSEATRWLPFGPVTLQPSELMKVVVIAYLAAFFHNHLGNWHIWRPMLVIGLAAGFVVMQPNVSTALFLFALAFAIMLAAGTSIARLVSISLSAAIVAIVVGGPYLAQYSYISDRISGFADLWGDQVDVQTTSYQATRARAALARAGVVGIGPGRPVNVPEAETDMIAVAIGQSLGLIGMITLVGSFVLLVARGLRIAGAARGPGALLAAGACAYIGGQAALNLLVAAGLLPVTGVPLPFVSYGFNSLLSVAVATGFIHAAFREVRAQGAAL
ncbi:MAG: FtsW/RodA/SpoVE family cell cycle protein [Trueperaceae bacterium]|nr:FtsW/RodA/SpoVE family cell cycle protein [Trueperaceae bacterium]